MRSWADKKRQPGAAHHCAGWRAVRINDWKEPPRLYQAAAV
jgi:hypothetical protein